HDSPPADHCPRPCWRMTTVSSWSREKVADAPGERHRRQLESASAPCAPRGWISARPGVRGVRMSVSVSDVEPDIGLTTGQSEITIGRTTVQARADEYRRQLQRNAPKRRCGLTT